MWLDSHCHLNHERIEELGLPSDIIRSAKQAGVSGMMTICCEIDKEFSQLNSIATANENVWCSVGTHPHDAGAETEKKYTTNDIINMVNDNPKVVAIGETGLDYYYDNSPREEQKDSFRKHIRASLESDTALVIHTRDAEDDTIQILKEEGVPKGVLHCFSGSRDLAERGLELGLLISFSGIVTFKKATELQEIAKRIPLESMLIETDAPFLAPVPLRGKTNQPANVIHTGKFIADLRGVSQEEIATKTQKNFFELFPKAKDTWKSN